MYCVVCIALLLFDYNGQLLVHAICLVVQQRVHCSVRTVEFFPSVELFSYLTDLLNRF